MKIKGKVIRKQHEQQLWGCQCSGSFAIILSERRGYCGNYFSEPLQGMSYHESDTFKKFLSVEDK